MITYDVISPDGFSFFMNSVFGRKEDAEKAIPNLINERYSRQGYYNSATHGQLSLSEATELCRVSEIDLDEMELQFYDVM